MSPMSRIALFFALLLPLIAVALPPGTAEQITERIAPIGALCEQGQPCAAGGMQTAAGSGGSARTGQAVYDQFCSTCHAAGVAGAPKYGNAQAWQPRVAKGTETLYQHGINGFNAMPPRGTCADCSDEEVKSAVDYMVSAVQ